MEQLIFILYSCLSLLFLLLAFKLTRRRNNLPPGPPSPPIVGHLHLLKPPIHRVLHRLSQKYGPVLSLWFGSRLVIVVSSATVAEECFTKNDVVLANRPRTITSKHVGYNHTEMSVSSYGDHWRNLRRIGTEDIFSSSRLNTFLTVRTDEIRRFLLRLSRVSRDGFARVELRPMLTGLTLNNIMRMVAGKRYYDNDVASEEEEASKFRELISEVFRIGGGGALNYVDYLPPVLNWVGKWSFEKRVKNLAANFDGLLQGLIDEHQQGERKNTLIDHLLSLQKSQPEYYTDQIIKGLILVTLVAGTDTSAVTLEWAMSNLLNHPRVLKKVKQELDTQIGQENLLEEQDVSKLTYLQNVISETLRLYPPAPLLLPHVASANCTIGGYDVPHDTMVLVNVWGIHRDPQVWDDAKSFKPERFEKERKESHKLMAFGMGRRACPGAGLAHRMVGLALGSIIQCFDWEKVSEEEIEMSEGIGTTIPKAQPLEALCRARPIVRKVFYGAAN